MNDSNQRKCAEWKVLVYQVLGAILLNDGNFDHPHQRSLVDSQSPMITKSIIEGVDHQWFSLTKNRSAHVSASNREKVAVLLGVLRQRAKRGEPGQGEPTKDCLKLGNCSVTVVRADVFNLYALPPRFLHPSCLQ